MPIEPVQHGEIEVGSNRSFGVVFTVVFSLIALYPLIHGNSIRFWSLGIAVALLAVTLFAPGLLKPFNKLWFKLGMLMAMVVNPLVMFLIYIVAFVPIGLLLKLFGKDLLSLKLDDSSSSYWVSRDPPGPKPDSLNDQF